MYFVHLLRLLSGRGRGCRSASTEEPPAAEGDDSDYEEEHACTDVQIDSVLVHESLEFRFEFVLVFIDCDRGGVRIRRIPCLHTHHCIVTP